MNATPSDPLEQHANDLAGHLTFLYGEERSVELLPRLVKRLERTRERTRITPVPTAHRLTERDAVLITYADQVTFGREAPLRTLRRLLDEQLSDVVTGVHLLPFYPWTSDDGFSVVDYHRVDEAVGDWPDVEALAPRYRLVFDAVINHVSASSAAFQGFLHGDERYQHHFITLDPDTDVSSVVRPRTTPLLTPFQTSRGERHVWTTFSDDQIDLDYRHPEVLLEAVDVLLTYVERGARIIRLDAVTFLWKELGTSCVHLPQTHRIIQLLRSCIEAAAPDVVLLTETNVPHAENVGYFGNGYDEAQMVYNFALPPLTLHAVATGQVGELREWARALTTPSDETTFFNFLASHDGVGVRPVEALLEEADVRRLVQRAEAHGGQVSFRSREGADPAPYELNCSLYDLVNDPRADDPLALQVRRFLGVHAVMLSLAGVPGLYVHSLLGSRNAHELYARTGRARSLNRGRFEWAQLATELDDPQHRRRRVLDGFRRLMAVRTRHPAFHPQAPQRLPDAPDQVLAVVRGGVSSEVVCLQSMHDQGARVDLSALLGRPLPVGGYRDALGGGWSSQLEVALEPFETRWLEVPFGDA